LFVESGVSGRVLEEAMANLPVVVHGDEEPGGFG
jgi:hypothetical protein